jgi:deoxyhypusine synthase
VTWGKVDPEQLPDTVVCYTDSTIAMPIMAAYALGKRSPRPLKRLYDRREELLQLLADTYRENRPLDPEDLLEDGYSGGVVSR